MWTSDPPRFPWTPLVSSAGSEKVLDDEDATDVHGRGQAGGGGLAGEQRSAVNAGGPATRLPAYGSSRHRFAGRGLQGGAGWTRTLGRAWTRRSAPTSLAQAGPRPSADGGCRFNSVIRASSM